MFALRMGAMSIGQIAIAIVVIAAVCALVWVALKQFGIPLPQWVVQIFWILLVTVAVVFSIKLVLSF